MSSRRFVEWVHGEKAERENPIDPKDPEAYDLPEDTTRPAAPVSKSQQKHKRTPQKKTKNIYTAHDVEGRTAKEASPSEPED